MTRRLRDLLEEAGGSAHVPPTDVGRVVMAGAAAVRRRRVVGMAVGAAVALIAIGVPWAVANMDSDTARPIGPPGCETPWITGADEGSSESGEISNVSADLTEATTLRDNVNVPVFSPDGSRIVYVENRGDQLAGGYLRSALMVMDADGTDVSQLTNGRRDEARAAWSPDGTRIAYGSRRAIFEGDQWQRWSPYELRIANADGTGPRTVDLAAPLDPSDLAWRDDHTLLYTRDSAVWQINLDAEQPITPRRLTTYRGSTDGILAPFSPDGTTLVTRQLHHHPTRFDLAITNLATGAIGQEKSVANAWRVVRTLGWTRDGDLLFIRSARGPDAPWADRGVYEIWSAAYAGWVDDSARLLSYDATSDDITPYAVNPACDLPK